MECKIRFIFSKRLKKRPGNKSYRMILQINVDNSYSINSSSSTFFHLFDLFKAQKARR